MAFVMPFQTPDGADHPQSYWRPVYLELDYNGAGLVIFHGYHNQSMSGAGKEPIAKKQYRMPAPLLQQTYGPAAFKAGSDPLAQAYLLAQTTPEVNSGLSFFQGATNA